MDKFSYAIGLGIGQNLLSMGAQGINVEDFAQAISDVLNRKETAISHNEARDIVNQYFAELEAKMNAENIEKGKVTRAIMLLAAAPMMPPIAPSTVFLGLTLGQSLCLPNFIPVNSANVSAQTALPKTNHTRNLM